MRSLYLELKPHANAGEGITHMDVGIYPYLNAEEGKYWISARLKDGTAVRLWGPIRDGFVAGITARRMQNQASEPGAVEAKERKGYQIFPILEKAHLLSVLTNRSSDIPVFKNMARDRDPFVDLFVDAAGNATPGTPDTAAPEPEPAQREPEGPELFSSELGNGKSRKRGLFQL